MAFGTRVSLSVLKYRLRVSILVFLEWPLGRMESVSCGSPGNRVSILVFLEWPLGHAPPGSHRRPQIQFQSLFFWNGLWDTDQTA